NQLTLIRPIQYTVSPDCRRKRSFTRPPVALMRLLPDDAPSNYALAVEAHWRNLQVGAMLFSALAILYSDCIRATERNRDPNSAPGQTSQKRSVQAGPVWPQSSV